MKSSLRLLSLLFFCYEVTSFTSLASSPRTTVPITRTDLSSWSVPFFSKGGEASQDQVILQEFEKKESKLQKRRQEALAKLQEYEKSLQALTSQKAEYLAAVPDQPIGGSFRETAIRSAVKAFMWRIIAGSITFATTLRFSGSIKMALEVVGADFLSKSLTMFIGERLMNKTSAGRKSGADAASRSLAKALIWRLFAIVNTLTMAIFVSKNLSVASKIASTDAVFKTALMFVYERAWAKVQWGKEYLIEFAI